MNFRLAAVTALAAAFCFLPLRACPETNAARADLSFMAAALTQYHVNPFHSISRNAFNARVRRLAAELPTMTDAEVYVGLKQIIALIGDTHTGFGFSSAPPMNFFVFPMKIYRYPDGVYVQAAAPNTKRLSELGSYRSAASK
jgi:hypothetical protein